MNVFLAVVWDFNPTFFRIFGLDIRFYGLMWALTILIGSLFFFQFVRREGIPDKVADSIFLYGTLATIIGARLGHCLFYEPAHYLANPVEILKFRDGGLASHGAAIGLLIGLWLFSRRNKLPYLWSLDRIMIPVAIGGSLVRLGNLFNSEIYGRATDLPWGFIFVRNGETVPMHPTQIYEALCYLLLFFILCWLYYKKDMARRHPGLIFGVALIGTFLSRFLIEYVKLPQVAFEEGMRINMGQILSIPFIIVGVVMVVYGLRHKVVPPPLTSTAFFPKPVKKGADKPKPATSGNPKQTAPAKAAPKAGNKKPSVPGKGGKRK